MKNSIVVIVVGIVLCFFVAGRKIANFVGSFYPPAQANECLKINIDGIPVKLMVIQNDPKTKSSIVYVLNNSSVHKVSYGDLREMDAEKVACQ